MTGPPAAFFWHTIWRFGQATIGAGAGRVVFKMMFAFPLPLTPSEPWPPGHGLYRGVVEPAPAAPFDIPSAPLRALRDTANSVVTQLNATSFLETTVFDG